MSFGIISYAGIRLSSACVQRSNLSSCIKMAFISTAPVLICLVISCERINNLAKCIYLGMSLKLRKVYWTSGCYHRMMLIFFGWIFIKMPWGEILWRHDPPMQRSKERSWHGYVWRRTEMVVDNDALQGPPSSLPSPRKTALFDTYGKFGHNARHSIKFAILLQHDSRTRCRWENNLTQF